MKDYSKEITKIILSGIKIDRECGKAKDPASQLLELSEVVRKINLMIQNEIFSLEEEIVSLTEQLQESDSIILEARKKRATRMSMMA
jgi:hypothetical protein